MQHLSDLINKTEKANKNIQERNSLILSGVRNSSFYIGARAVNGSNSTLYLEDDRAIKLSELLETFQAEDRAAIKEDNESLKALDDLVGARS